MASVQQGLSAALVAVVAVCLTSACTGGTAASKPEVASHSQTPTRTATSSVEAKGIVGRQTGAWGCNANPDVAVQPLSGYVTFVRPCRWKADVTDPEDLAVIARLLARDDEKPGPLDDCVIFGGTYDPPVLVQTTEGMWVVQLPKTACGVTQPQVNEGLRAIALQTS